MQQASNKDEADREEWSVVEEVDGEPDEELDMFLDILVNEEVDEELDILFGEQIDEHGW